MFSFFSGLFNPMRRALDKEIESIDVEFVLQLDTDAICAHAEDVFQSHLTRCQNEDEDFTADNPHGWISLLAAEMLAVKYMAKTLMTQLNKELLEFSGLVPEIKASGCLSGTVLSAYLKGEINDKYVLNDYRKFISHHFHSQLVLTRYKETPDNDELIKDFEKQTVIVEGEVVTSNHLLEYVG